MLYFCAVAQVPVLASLLTKIWSTGGFYFSGNLTNRLRCYDTTWNICRATACKDLRCVANSLNNVNESVVKSWCFINNVYSRIVGMSKSSEPAAQAVQETIRWREGASWLLHELAWSAWPFGLRPSTVLMIRLRSRCGRTWYATW